NPKLEKQIATFITQEALHTREHLAFNRLASERGYDLSEIDRFLSKRISFARSRPEREQLAATIALEHFTAILAHELLRDPRYLDGVPTEIQQLWRWHAVEEIEHKGVAFDTFLAATADISGLRRWFIRSYVMVITTILFFHEVGFGVSRFFRQDGINTPKTWFRFLHYLLVRPGMLRRVIASYFTYYRPGFHPWHVDDRPLISMYEPQLAL
ncbi:MAG: metal-dependent hydrolase, partial [Alphaproteobacteria bacterium]|nr:metal-dependent hydrolase [Alphaproteobacteria bacterium]